MICVVLSLLGILSLDWNFWPFLGIFRKHWKYVKWIISVYFANHVWFYFWHLSWCSDFMLHHHRFMDFLCKIGIFWYCSWDFWSCICERPGYMLCRTYIKVIQLWYLIMVHGLGNCVAYSWSVFCVDTNCFLPLLCGFVLWCLGYFTAWLSFSLPSMSLISLTYFISRISPTLTSVLFLGP